MPWTVRAVAIRRCQEIAARYPRRVTADVERIVYAGERVEVGAFRCPVEHPDFRDAGQIRDHCVLVFPRTAVRIRHAGQRAFTTDATVAVFYNPQQPFVRERVDPAGDRCEWFALDTETAAEVAAGLDPAAHAAAPFRFTHGPVDAASYYRQRALFQTLARPAPADALEIEEEASPSRAACSRRPTSPAGPASCRRATSPTGASTRRSPMRARSSLASSASRSRSARSRARSGCRGSGCVTCSAACAGRRCTRSASSCACAPRSMRSRRAAAT